MDELTGAGVGRRGHDEEQPPGMPRWVKVLAVALVVLVVVAILAMLVFGGDHGPGRHLG